MMTVERADGTRVQHQVGKDFLLAGKATFTIRTPGGHRTYKIVRKEATGQWPETFFVNLLTGPDNESSYTYLGKLDPFTGQVVPTAKSGWREKEAPYHVTLLNRVLARVWSFDHAAFERHGYQLLHAGKCGRCGRTLTVPASIETGIGPECVKHLRSY
jgi:hypothetical protein